METCRGLRELASSLIHGLAIWHDTPDLSEIWLRYPRHANPRVLELTWQWGVQRPAWADEDLLQVISEDIFLVYT